MIRCSEAIRCYEGIEKGALSYICCVIVVYIVDLRCLEGIEESSRMQCNIIIIIFFLSLGHLVSGNKISFILR